MAILREALEHTQAEAKQARGDADRLQAETDQLRAEHEANTDRILELEAAYDDLVELQHKTMCEFAERKAQDQQDEEAREAVEQAEKAREDALQALAQERQHVATLESQNEQLRERLAATQSTHKRKKRRGRKK